MKAQVELTEQRFTDLIVGALEGGSNYWYQFDKVEFPDYVGEVVYFSEKMAEALYANKGWCVPVYDIEEDEVNPAKPLGILSYMSCEKGWQLLAQNHPEALANILGENDDASDADIFFQLCVMGEVVYG